MDPTISVVMSAYNGRNYIAEAICGVLEQTFGDFEVIIVDDGSTDDTVAIIEGFADPRIRLIRNRENLGISATRNVGMAAARGRLIACHDQDDVSLPHRLETHLRAFDSDPRVVLSAGRVRYVPAGRLWPPLPLPDGAAAAWRLFVGSYIQHSAACIRAGALDGEPYYRQEYHYAEDFEMYHRLSERGRIVVSPEVIGVYREHAMNTGDLKWDEMNENGKRFLLQRFRDYLGPARATDTAFDSLWHVCILGEPARSLHELDAVGALLDAHVAAFVARRRLDGGDRVAVLAEASRNWWAAVQCAGAALGPAALKRYGAWPNLSHGTVGLIPRVKASLKAALRAG